MNNKNIISYLEDLVKFREAEYKELCEFNRFSNDDAQQYLSKTDEILKQIDNLKSDEKKEETWKDQYLYLKSDFENVKKRFNKERTDIINNAAKDIIADLLPVIDNFEKAIDSVRSVGENYVKGLELTYNEIIKILESEGCTKIIVDKGTVFDPNLHNAICTVDDTKKLGSNIVQSVVRSGWILNGSLLRATDVVVTKSI